jgi:pyruvate dehydrogenase E1 component alpha subunit/2-oxoisovalerate dehydrogenase E1 component alpha subunit
MSLEETSSDAPDMALLRVLRDDGATDPATDPRMPPDLLWRAYREMRRLRLFEERMISMQRQGRVSFYGGARGQEAVPVAAGLAVRDDDWVFPALREQSIMLVRGFPLRAFVAQIFGNSGDILKGRQMPCHQSSRRVHHVSWSSCVASQLPHAVGAAWAMRARKTGSVALAFVGDGATSHGDFHAAMNFAGVWQVPCVIVCQNNQWSISVPVQRQTASPTIAIKARAYGMPGLRLDGNDLLAAYSVVRSALERARAGGGPTFIEAVTYRMGAHSTSDDPARYRSRAEEQEWAAKDPLDRLRRHLAGRGQLSDAADEALGRELSGEIGAAIDEVEGLPPPALETLFEDVYRTLPWHLREQLAVAKSHGERPPREEPC